jgi:hypothetical protein
MVGTVLHLKSMAFSKLERAAIPAMNLREWVLIDK